MRATIESDRSGASVTLGNESMADTSTGELDPADAGELGGQDEQIGRIG